MKNSFSLLEIILTLFISLIIIIYSTLFTKELFFENKINQETEIKKMDLLSTKIFIEKNKNRIDDFKFFNENLYFKNNLLLENVKEFQINKMNDKLIIFINLDNKIKQNWEFLL